MLAVMQTACGGGTWVRFVQSSFIALPSGDLLFPRSSKNTVFPLVLIKNNGVTRQQSFRNTSPEETVSCGQTPSPPTQRALRPDSPASEQSREGWRCPPKERPLTPGCVRF